MYSYEQRIRAVKLYMKLGKRVGATILQLGYPTKNALKNWYREYEQNQAVPQGYARSRPKYSVDQKLAAVNFYLEHGRCISTTEFALGYRIYRALELNLRIKPSRANGWSGKNQNR